MSQRKRYSYKQKRKFEDQTATEATRQSSFYITQLATCHELIALYTILIIAGAIFLSFSDDANLKINPDHH
jgi:hypothetical protein